VTVHALDVGCFPSAPLQANFWLDIKLLELFRPLQFQNGMSADGAHLVVYPACPSSHSYVRVKAY
jgi:hypothetical protein